MKKCLNCGYRFHHELWKCARCEKTPTIQDSFPIFAPELLTSDDGFEASFFETLTHIEPGHFWFEARNRLLIWAFQQYFSGASNCLEIGCGTGFVLDGLRKSIPELALIGSDLYVEGLAFTAERVPDATLLQMDARQIPFVNEFDVIGAFDVLEHIEEDEDVLVQMYDAVKPGGGIMVTVPQHQFLWSYSDEYAHHKRRYTRGELLEKACRAGFTVERSTSFVSLLLPMMMLSRQRSKNVDVETIDVLSEFKISSSLNAILAGFMSIEAKLISAGISFPAGGSLLLVGRKS